MRVERKGNIDSSMGATHFNFRKSNYLAPIQRMSDIAAQCKNYPI